VSASRRACRPDGVDTRSDRAACCVRSRPGEAPEEAATLRAPLRPRSLLGATRFARARTAPPRRRVFADRNGSRNEAAHASRARDPRTAPGRDGRGRGRPPARPERRRRAIASRRPCAREARPARPGRQQCARRVPAPARSVAGGSLPSPARREARGDTGAPQCRRTALATRGLRGEFGRPADNVRGRPCPPQVPPAGRPSAAPSRSR
jgi:hypothetical protein